MKYRSLEGCLGGERGVLNKKTIEEHGTHIGERDESIAHQDLKRGRFMAFLQERGYTTARGGVKDGVLVAFARS